MGRSGPVSLARASSPHRHEDNENEVSFSMQAQYNWYNHNQPKMLEIFDQPNNTGYDEEIFTDQRTHMAVNTVGPLCSSL